MISSLSGLLVKVGLCRQSEFLSLEKELSVVKSSKESLSFEKNRLLDEVVRLNSLLETMHSVVENKDNVIYDKVQLDLLRGNEECVEQAGLYKEWLLALLLNGSVNVPEDCFKVFFQLLRSLYGYERMRYRWEWVEIKVGSLVFNQFSNRKVRRTK